MGKFNGLKLHDERMMQGMKQIDLAKALGVSRQAVAQWESGKTIPDPENILKINDVLSHNSAGRDINFFTPQSDIDVKLDKLSERVITSKTLSSDAKIEVLTMITELKHEDN